MTNIKSFNCAIDQNVIRNIMFSKSILESVASGLLHMMGKSASQLTFEDLKNIKKTN